MNFFDSVPLSGKVLNSSVTGNNQVFNNNFFNPVGNIKNNDSNGSFKNIFQNAISDVIETDKNYTNKQYLLASGQIDNAADVTVAASQAQLAVELLVQLRNSALNAYNEVLRINV